MTLPDLEAQFAHASTEHTHHRDQHLGIVACREALAAARAGNYGVGAVLVDPKGNILEHSRNSVFFPHFRSDFHAEMLALNSSLEPCPMCMARLLMAGVQTVKFLAYDELAGMVNQRQQFPIAWKRLWERQEFVQADVSESLKQFARDVFSLNLETCRQKLLSR